MSLTDKQLDAINEVDRHLQIIACAGSGKTDVVSRRIAQIISRNLAKPEEVVAFTFTEKAAAELKERIYRYVTQEIGTTEGLAGLYIGTIHGYCLELLQTHVPELFKYRVLPEIQNKLFVNRYSTQSGLTACPTSSVGTPFLKRGINTGLYINALSVFREDDVDYDQISTDFKNAHNQYVNLLQNQIGRAHV